MQLTPNQAQPMLSTSIFGMRLPSAISYKFAKLLKILQTEMQDVEAHRRKLIEEYGGAINPDGTRFEFPEGKEAEFTEAFTEVTKVPFDIGVNFPVPMPDITISPAELSVLAPLFVFPDDVPLADNVAELKSPN